MKEDPGSRVYSVEAAVLGVLGMGWLAVRESTLGGSLLDYVCFSALLYGSLLSLLCGVFLHLGRVQKAYLGLALGVWHLYLYGVIAGEAVGTSSGSDGNATGCVANADPRALMRTALFGGVPMHQAPAGLSLGALTVNALVAAAAVGPQVWRLCGWTDVAALGVLGLHAALSGRGGMSPDLQGGGSGGLGLLAGVHLLFLGFDAVWQRRVVGARADDAATRKWVQVGWLGLLAVEFAVVSGVASRHGLFSWGLGLLFGKAMLHRAIVLAIVYWANGGKAEEAASEPPPPPAAPAQVTADLVLAPPARRQVLFSAVRFPIVRDKKRM